MNAHQAMIPPKWLQVFQPAYRPRKRLSALPDKKSLRVECPCRSGRGVPAREQLSQRKRRRWHMLWSTPALRAKPIARSETQSSPHQRPDLGKLIPSQNAVKPKFLPVRQVSMVANAIPSTTPSFASGHLQCYGHAQLSGCSVRNRRWQRARRGSWMAI
jgi:hypothetical protein